MWPSNPENMRPWTVLFLLFCYACLTSGQGNVNFTSKNFFNILRWNPAEPRFPGEKVRYSVLYSDTDAVVFKRKAECQNITELFCDLTDETPAVYDAHYRAKVLVDGSDYGQTIRFKPVAETILGAPILFPNIIGTSLHLNVELPLGPNNESFSDIFRKIKMGRSEVVTVYSLNITKPQGAVHEIESTLGHFVVNLKDDQMEYCGSVVYKPALEWGRPLSEEASFCVNQQDNSWMLWTILSVVVLASVVLTGACCAKHYVTDVKKTLPQSLDINPQQLNKYSYKARMDPNDDHNFSNLEITTTNEKTEYAEIQKIATDPPAVDGGYGHSHSLRWSENSSLGTVRAPSPALHYQNESTESSVIYGDVAVRVEDDIGVVESGPLLPSLKTITLPSVDVYESNEAQPLLLQTQRNSDGLLTLPLLSLQVQQPFSGTAEALVSLERKPLLSYLTVSSDKGSNFVSLHSLDSSDFGSDENTLPTPTQDYSNSHYLPTQPDCTHFSPDSQSSLLCDSRTYDTPYKQNWMPHAWNF